MYDFLGKDIFNIMVIIATNKRNMEYQIEFDEENLSATRKVFTAAFERAILSNSRLHVHSLTVISYIRTCRCFLFTYPVSGEGEGGGMRVSGKGEG